MMQNIFRNITLETQQLLFVLLFLFVIACLGAMPIVPLLLARLPSPELHTPSSTTYTEGECPASSIHVLYTPPIQHIPVPTPLPRTRRQAHRTALDYKAALAWAATFVEDYESFDYHQMASLYTAIPLLSTQAKKRFYEGDGTVSVNIRTDVAWQNKLKQNRIIQVARISLPTLADSTYTGGVIYLTLQVPYQTIEQLNGQATMQHHAETVLLRGIAPGQINNGTGWQISDWHENT